MSIHELTELADVLPTSAGARILLQNYFLKNNISKETRTSSELPLATNSTSSVTPTMTLTLMPQQAFDMTASLDREVSMNNNKLTSSSQAPIENAIHPSLTKTSSVNDSQEIRIFNTSYDEEPAKKIQRIETVIDTVENMVVCRIFT